MNFSKKLQILTDITLMYLIRKIFYTIHAKGGETAIYEIYRELEYYSMTIYKLPFLKILEQLKGN